MAKRKIKLSIKNGLSFDTFCKEVFDVNMVSEDYDLVESDQPDYIIFGPYGNDIPASGNYTRIGYFCENIVPDFSICEWAFGMPSEQVINHPKYKKIQWHGLDPKSLIKNIDDNQIDEITSTHVKFCNFIYSNPVPYREEFFRQLSKYKHVDAPGKSMNNMSSIDTFHTGDIWERKRKFLAGYKFTIAFENYCYPGYQTEKLYDAMQVNSIPVYCGDPFVDTVFNTKSFINARDYMEVNDSGPVHFFEEISQLNFRDIRPQFYRTPKDHLSRKLKKWGRRLKMKMQFNKLDFSDLIDRIIEVDKDPALYKQYLREPWFRDNAVPEQHSSRLQWRKIFGDG